MIRLASKWPWRITRCPRKWLCNNSVQCTPDAIRPCLVAVISICWSRTRAWLWWVCNANYLKVGGGPTANSGWLRVCTVIGFSESATITTHDVAAASAVAIVVATSTAAAAAAYWSTPRRRFDPAGYSCNLFQFVWTAKLVSHRVHALQSTAHNTPRSSSPAPSLLSSRSCSFALLNQLPGHQFQSQFQSIVLGCLC